MRKIVIHEVGLRDGLQMEKTVVPTDKKIQWAKKLIDSKIDIIQLGSFVNPEKVPQMADTDKLFNYFNLKEHKPEKTILSGLILNEKGASRALECGVDLVCMGVSASNTHSLKNTGMSREEATTRIINIAKDLMNKGLNVQTSVQSAFGCGFEGYINPDIVIDIVKQYLDAGLRNISLADTAGHAYPSQVEELYGRILEFDKDLQLACHFHNTYGLGLANCYSALRTGVTIVETAFGGLGGCPFTKLSAGNVCTEDFIHSINRENIRSDIKINQIIELTKEAEVFFNKSLPGYIYKSGIITINR